MKIKMDQEIKNYEEKPMKDSNGKIATVRGLIVIALNSQAQNEVLTAEKKVKMYQISIKVWENNEVDLTVDDRAFIKERAAKFLGALPLGRLSDILEEKK